MKALSAYARDGDCTPEAPPPVGDGTVAAKGHASLFLAGAARM